MTFDELQPGDVITLPCGLVITLKRKTMGKFWFTDETIDGKTQPGTLGNGEYAHHLNRYGATVKRLQLGHMIADEVEAMTKRLDEADAANVDGVCNWHRKQQCPFCNSTNLYQETVDVGVGLMPIAPVECMGCGSGQNDKGVWMERDPNPYANKLVDANTGTQGIPISDTTIDMLMTKQNEDYAARQERHKQEILREMKQPWQSRTNGLGSAACVMQGRRGQ